MLCRKCVIGNVLPVWRPAIERWRIGELTAFDDHSGKHHVVFLDDTEDWVVVEQSPFDEYLDYQRGRARQHSTSDAESEMEPFPLLPSHQQGKYKQLFQTPDKENERLMQVRLNRSAAVYIAASTRMFTHHVSSLQQKVLKRLDANGGEEGDWSLRHVAEASGESPAKEVVSRGVSNLESCGLAGEHEKAPEKPLSSFENVHPSCDPVSYDDTKYTTSSASMPTWSLHEDYQRSGPRLWTVEVRVREVTHIGHEDQSKKVLSEIVAYFSFSHLQEDRDLINGVKCSPDPIKWSVIAESIPGRSGKQCRERYLNHLKPKLNIEEWSALEDALLFQMYTVYGSKWALMRKRLAGRTDNRIKNRFHFLRRRLEKVAVKMLQDKNVNHPYKNIDHPDKIPSSTAHVKNAKHGSLTTESCDLLAKIRDILPHLAAETLKSEESLYSFGPFRTAQSDICNRCNLFVPSVQTGHFICEVTGWCEACTRLPPYVSGSSVRDCLELRKEDHMPSKTAMQSSN